MFWRKPQQDSLRPIVIGNLERLKRLFNSRGRRFDFNRDASTSTLEDGLWVAVSEAASDVSLSFAPNMPLEHRIAQIERQLEPLSRPGTRHKGAWPSWIR